MLLKESVPCSERGGIQSLGLARRVTTASFQASQVTEMEKTIKEKDNFMTKIYQYWMAWQG
jgi:hypothetical protein